MSTSSNDRADRIDEKAVAELEAKYDNEMRFRPMANIAATTVTTLLIALSCFHYYTAGFGLLREATHRGVHLAFVLGLIFLVFAFNKKTAAQQQSSWHHPLGLPLYDWLCAIAAVAAALYIPYVFDDLAFRVGNPDTLDVVMGTTLIVLLLEATRRAMGWPLPIIAIVFMLYAMFGPVFPGLLKHAGATWSQVVNHQYLTSQGVYGIAVGVVATYVFHFVLFGVLATRIGLGQLFLDVASSIAGKYAGGPAKVSVFGSAMFGMLSGSSVANAVTVGSLTIPAMIKVGYPRHFAGGVEAAASTGGQITPPIMGAAAFLMIEFLALPYSTIVIAAIAPAFMHFFGVFWQVHFEAKRTGLRGLSADELPSVKESFRKRWPTLIPLVLLVGTLMSGFTPYVSAFAGITSCIIVGLTTSEQGNNAKGLAVMLVLHAVLAIIISGQLENYGVVLFAVAAVVFVALLKTVNLPARFTRAELIDAFSTGAKYALAVGAAAGTVGLVIGVVTLTGVGFKVSYIVNAAAASMAEFFTSFLPAWLASKQTLMLLSALFMTGFVCILMGCGIPTTANYIIMVTVAAPALVQMGVEPIVAHFFVFYYGVLADITPPVALAAYAAAGMANSDPFKTGNTAFRLGLGKALVPLIFVFSPALLIVTKGFTWEAFAVVFTACIISILLLAAALSRFLLVEMKGWERALTVVAALVMIAPGVKMLLLGIALASPMLLSQALRHREALRRQAA
ncbi:TRAP transporter permease [Casimicrobium huifangae]|uniref:TRAP transporter permease n=1 Tax=Casimicrobium huifangae TaxID=2591109 RepID=UPI0012EC1239|nr:TRAP transporter permease [Casimicrobium huifangae]